jgi:diguanylate cyclase (GGDEF)-like protein/PAS domain S-box-containing protein
LTEPDRIPEAHLGPLFEASSDSFIVTDAQGMIRHANVACSHLLGYGREELLGQPIEFLVPARFADHVRRREEYAQAPHARAMGSKLDLTANHKDGHEIQVDIALTPLELDGERFFVASIRDMRKRASASETLHVQATALRSAANGVVITDRKGFITWVNAAASRITGYAEEELLGSHTRMLKSGEHGDAFYGELWSTVMGGETWSGTIVNRRKDGSTYHEEQTIAPVVDDTGEITHFIGIKQDVSKRLAAESALMRAREELAARVKQIEALNVRLQQQALRDPLTGLFNRRYFREAVPREFAAAQRRQDPISIAVLDVDRFKLVNDVHGHAMGDEVLLALAEVLTDGVRSSDLICRFGGDEFVIVFPGTTAEVGEARAEALCQAFRSLRFTGAHGDALQATISIGVATTGEGDAPIDVLMAQADAALYSAKRGGRDRVVVNRE